MLSSLILSLLPLVAQTSSGVGTTDRAGCLSRVDGASANRSDIVGENERAGITVAARMDHNPHPRETGLLTAVSPSSPTEALTRTPDSLRSFHYSLAALIGAQTFDAVSSVGLRELNPILGRGNFGARQVAVKGSIVGAVVIGELLVVKRWPASARVLKWVNFGDAGITAAVAVHNWREH